jgi:hypothetical protein
MIRRWFRALGNGSCGQVEDPAEDVFVSRVVSSQGNFRMFEGIWETAAFDVRRLLGVIETMPAGMPFDDFRASAFALLALSEMLAERASVPSYSLGAEWPLKAIPNALVANPGDLRRLVRFTPQELQEGGIDLAALRPFVLPAPSWNELASASLGHSLLERRPLVLDGSDICVLLPTAICVAVRRLVIEECWRLGYGAAFDRALTQEYGRLLHELPLLGGRVGAPIRFQQWQGVHLSGVSQCIDAGRYINWVFFADSTNGYEAGGLSGANPAPEQLGAALASWIKRSQAKCASRPDFREGTTLIVGCGWGRSMLMSVPRADERWRIEVMNAAAIETLSLTPRFKPTSLWRTLDAIEAVQKRGVELQWINGLLNLIAWERSLDQNLIPHARLPDDLTQDGLPAILVIPQNGLRALRHEVATYVDACMMRDGNGKSVFLRRYESSVFPEDNARPLYVSHRDLVQGNRLRGVYIDNVRSWWIEVTAPQDAPRSLMFEYWKMACGWLRRLVPVLEQRLKHLPTPTITWSLHFDGLSSRSRDAVVPPDADELPCMLHIDVSAAERSVRLQADAAFDAAFHHPENIAEKALVEAMVRGMVQLCGSPSGHSTVQELVELIVPNTAARHIHFFRARFFRDFVSGSLREWPTEINLQDVAFAKLGLGWLARPRTENPTIEGKAECTTFLNATVQALEEELCGYLKRFGRRNLLLAVLLNHEAACHQRDRWNRTAAANIAPCDDKSATVDIIIRQQAKLNAISLNSRIVMEASICECPEEGDSPGTIDISRLMTNASLIYHLGGWSNAIRWDAMEPRLKISPLGDIMTASRFEDDVLAPFGRASGGVEIGEAVEAYDRNYSEVSISKSLDGAIDAAFLTAWEEEFGFSADDLRLFIHNLEDFGVSQENPIQELHQSALLALESDVGTLAADTAKRILEALALRSRPAWRVVPQGFSDRDRQPWRFRRRLSLMRRPLIQLDEDDTDDPRFLVAPGMVREHFMYLFSGLYRGDFPDSFVTSRSMKSWIGAENHRRGHAFNVQVATRMKELGWQTRHDGRLTALLGRSLDRDYGDVDVLAWSPSTGRILVMECKDVQFKKTHGEISEQIADFRGGFDAAGKPDLLRKHLDRCELLERNIDVLARQLGVSVPPSLERHLVFRNPVPMRFAWERLHHHTRLDLYDDLQTI